MKKVLGLSLVFGITFSFLFIGCKGELADISESSTNKQSVETESLALETNYGKFIESKIKLFDKTLNVLEISTKDVETVRNMYK